MLPQDLFTLIQNSSEVRVVADNAKCVLNNRRSNTFQAARRTQSQERPELISPPPVAPEKEFFSNGISLPARGNFRWDPEASFTDDAEPYGHSLPSRIGGEPNDNNPGGSVEERKRSSMGLSLPVRRNSTDSIDAATLAEIFGDLDLLDSDEEEQEEDDDSSVSSSSIDTSTSSTVSSSSL